MASISFSTIQTLTLNLALLLLIAPTITIIMGPTTAIAQTPNTTIARTDTFAMDGQIGSLVLGMPPDTKVIDMTTVPKFILSGGLEYECGPRKVS
jgi:hypothetical protein